MKPIEGASAQWASSTAIASGERAASFAVSQ
jgi:hypothetical protein